MIKMKTYVINHIPIKQMWLEKNIMLIKYVQKKVDEKMLKNLMKKRRLSIVNQKNNVQKVGSPKNEGVEKT